MSASEEHGRLPAHPPTEVAWYETPRHPPQRAGRPVAGPQYLSDFNYYRLAYQSAADRLNSLIGDANDRRAAQKRLEQPALDAAPRVERLMRDVDATLEVLALRERRGRRFGRIRSLTSYDRKLQTFLRRTVRPSALLLQAQLGLLTAEWRLTTDADAARSDLTRTAELEKTLAQDPDSSASYRVLYNLACVEAQRTRLTSQLAGGDAAYADALKYLEQALAITTPPQRAHLQNWALKDPSLDPVRRDDEKRFRVALGLEAAAH